MGSYAITRKTQHGFETALALQIHKKNGEKLAIWYYEIVSPIHLKSEKEIELVSGNFKIRIEGNRMSELFWLLCEHRLAVIREISSDFTVIKPNEVSITGIQLETIT